MLKRKTKCRFLEWYQMLITRMKGTTLVPFWEQTDWRETQAPLTTVLWFSVYCVSNVSNTTVRSS